VSKPSVVGDYKENPKTKGSGIICAIPQKGACPRGCADCFFQSGRSYLEPLDENTPNMPSEEEAEGRVVRVNDGNDSNTDRYFVEEVTTKYPLRFFNTSWPSGLGEYSAPVVLTVNPGEMTDKDFHKIELPPKNLMFVRVRVNTWNFGLGSSVVAYYARDRKVPVVLTFMAYYDEGIPAGHRRYYEFRKRTLNSYWCIKEDKWRKIIKFLDGPLVYSCSGPGPSGCKHCGNCLREFYATRERMRKDPV